MPYHARRLARHALLSVLALALPQVLPAQSTDTTSSCRIGGRIGAVAESRESAQLPVDRIADLLALEPGVTSLDQGDLSIRGAGPGAMSAYLDGVPVTPGHRGSSALLGGSYFGDRGTGIGVGTNAFDHLLLYRGLGPAELGNGRGGVLAIATASPCAQENDLRGGLATDAVFGKTNGLGFNRVTLSGNRSVGKLNFGGAAVVEGQSSARLGLDQNGSPIFLSGGIDTTVSFDPGGGPISVDVIRFRKSEGIRIPYTPNSSYTVNGRVGYELGGGQRIEVSAYASQQQDRQFDYNNIYDPLMARADRSWSRMITGSWSGRLKTSEAFALKGEAYLSWQTDRSIDGPLSGTGERDTRGPFGGFLLSPVNFRFDFDNFAVNDELVRNFRTNSGRLSPYDLRNPDQYQPTDIYRNNAYGLTGFTETGGPVGLLTLSQENRLVGKGVVDATIGGQHRVRAGLELTRYDVDFYQSQLISQALSNAYIESPTHSALFGDYTLTLGAGEVNAGIRYDRFKSGASRPDFPRISSAPGFDPANPTAGFSKDKSHGRFSPQIRGAYQATRALRFNGGIGSVAQIPDFVPLFSGINTDLGTTSTIQPYGTDLDFEHATVEQIGAELTLPSNLSMEANFWHRNDEKLVALGLVSELDETRGSNADIYRFKNSGSFKATGLDLRVARSFGGGKAWLSYTYTDVTHDFGLLTGSTTVDVAESRPHTVTGAVLYQTGSTVGLLGGILRNVGVYGSFRIASGTAYSRCLDVSALSDEACPGGAFTGEINGSRLPMLKLIDLRLTRSLNVGRSQLVAFVDARNLLNSRNLIRVFSSSGNTTSNNERDFRRAGNLDEFANEAQDNGVRQVDGTIDLTFAGIADPRAGCGSWIRGGRAAAPNCVYLINAEKQFGNGDHLFTTAEQTRASDALYYVDRGQQNFTGAGRRVRIGLELRL